MNGEVERSKWRRIIGYLLLLSLLVTIMDVTYLLADERWQLLNPDGEFRPYRGEWPLPVVISIGMLFYAGLCWVRLGRPKQWPLRREKRYLGYFFFFMSADDLLGLHERIERYLQIDWVVLYAPVMIVALVVTVRIVTSLWATDKAAVVWLVFGAACWGVAEVLETMESMAVPIDYLTLVVPEEILETLGAAAFAISALHARFRRETATRLNVAVSQD